jgi:D-lyxose ketol-isomerase
MYLKEGQRSPQHFHKSKMEDIINLGPGNVMVQIWKADKNAGVSGEKTVLQIDGRETVFNPGDSISLNPGESVSMVPGIIHQFWAEEGKGPTVSMEVSSLNDDLTDNIWIKKAQRFPQIEEDEAKKYILCNEY